MTKCTGRFYSTLYKYILRSETDKSGINMMRYFLKAIVPAIVFTIIYFLIDIVIGKKHPFLDYAIQTTIFIVVFGLGTYLDDKGWNSWKKIGSLFKRKKADN